MPRTPAELRKNLHLLAPLTQDQVWKLYEIERKAIARFDGQIEELEAALGVLHLGFHVGWKPLVLVHNKRTIRNYEEILGITIKEYFFPEGPSAERSRGYAIAKKLGSFWKAASGELKNDELKESRRSIE